MSDELENPRRVTRLIEEMGAYFAKPPSSRNQLETTSSSKSFTPA